MFSGTSFRRKPESRNPHVCRLPAPGLKNAGTSFAGMTTEGDVPVLGQPPRKESGSISPPFQRQNG